VGGEELQDISSAISGNDGGYLRLSFSGFRLAVGDLRLVLCAQHWHATVLDSYYVMLVVLVKYKGGVGYNLHLAMVSQ
jgi:hypothetical protein